MRKLCLLAFMDLGTRQVIRHRLMLPFGLRSKASCQDVVALMSSVISSRQRPRICHSDSDGIFTGSVLVNCFILVGGTKITVSTTTRLISYPKAERFHLTFKDWLHSLLYDELLCLYGAEVAKTREAAWDLLGSKPLQ